MQAAIYPVAYQSTERIFTKYCGTNYGCSNRVLCRTHRQCVDWARGYHKRGGIVS
ncbi:hypothetical protein K443DRAFT_680524 [Laccaria amethystina LaAM-08-1]|uniref:Uncharacterized protein n=1 Tax=Laccaria amethystina LaAM-08-1 TaxID=1095629 RepID=A0A0C9WN39_9AGAR|nr:hypothetical protein K443DRAFT_680524 [Laccaria amethystina LaAM-08-1]